MAKRKRLVRKQPLGSRIANYPFDLLLSLSESFELVDWDAQAYSIGLPMGSGCCTLLLLCRIYSSLSVKKSESNIEDALFRNNKSGTSLKVPQRRPFFTVLFSTLSLILILLCLINTMDCIRKKKKYTLMGRAVTNEPDTPSAKKIKYQDPQDHDALPGSPLQRIMGSWSKLADKPAGEDLWELNIWDPPKFNLYLGATFSPLHVLYILYGPLGLFQLVMLAALSGWLFGMTFMFETLIKDKAIIHSEVLGEYGKKVVKPITAVSKRDVAIGTDGSTEVYSPMPHGTFSPRDVRESKSRVSMTPTPNSPWMSPIKSTNTPSSLRHRASMNSLSSNQRLHPAGYSGTPRRSLQADFSQMRSSRTKSSGL